MGLCPPLRDQRKNAALDTDKKLRNENLDPARCWLRWGNRDTQGSQIQRASLSQTAAGHCCLQVWTQEPPLLCPDLSLANTSRCPDLTLPSPSHRVPNIIGWVTQKANLCSDFLALSIHELAGFLLSFLSLSIHRRWKTWQFTDSVQSWQNIEEGTQRWTGSYRQVAEVRGNQELKDIRRDLLSLQPRRKNQAPKNRKPPSLITERPHNRGRWWPSTPKRFPWLCRPRVRKIVFSLSLKETHTKAPAGPHYLCKPQAAAPHSHGGLVKQGAPPICRSPLGVVLLLTGPWGAEAIWWRLRQRLKSLHVWEQTAEAWVPLRTRRGPGAWVFQCPVTLGRSAVAQPKPCEEIHSFGSLVLFSSLIF